MISNIKDKDKIFYKILNIKDSECTYLINSINWAGREYIEKHGELI